MQVAESITGLNRSNRIFEVAIYEIDNCNAEAVDKKFNTRVSKPMTFLWS